MEIIRAVFRLEILKKKYVYFIINNFNVLKFSIPVPQLQNAKQKRHIDYDNAHQIENNCTMHFPLCPENIWNAQFIIESDATIY